ncbi:hypothetical protein ACFVRB_11370 [Streptomyces nojiriensis]
MKHPERMPDEEPYEILYDLTEIMFLGIGPLDRPKLVVMGEADPPRP